MVTTSTPTNVALMYNRHVPPTTLTTSKYWDTNATNRGQYETVMMVCTDTMYGMDSTFNFDSYVGCKE